MSTPKGNEGFLDFPVPTAGKACQTWYTTFGDYKPGTRALVVLHGGPGVPHDYLLPISDVASSYGIPVIMYDQLGCGNSTHLKDKYGDGSFFNIQLFLDELDNLLEKLGIKDDYDILGHSWGGMLASEHAIRQPKGLRKLIISCSPADMKTWVDVANKLRAELPEDVQETLKKHEADGTTESEEYEAAVNVYYERHVCRVKPFPDDMLRAFSKLKEDDTVSMTMNGPSEFFITGTLKTWSNVDRLHNIKVPTLLLNGKYDEAQDECVEPYSKHIPDCKWVKFANSSHTPQWEERKEYMTVVGDFLRL
ncbi:hypothetical protein MMC18_005697 [Xylographa bjoerkii]|nr:hypothetical protein [Xylographa bjoerkii]